MLHLDVGSSVTQAPCRANLPCSKILSDSRKTYMLHHDTYLVAIVSDILVSVMRQIPMKHDETQQILHRIITHAACVFSIHFQTNHES